MASQALRIPESNHNSEVTVQKTLGLPRISQSKGRKLKVRELPSIEYDDDTFKAYRSKIYTTQPKLG